MERVFNDIVAFDIEVTQVGDLVPYMQFEKITRQITLNNREFSLRAVVERLESQAHFVVHVLRKNGEWQSIDDMKVSQIGEPPAQLHVVLLIYCAVGPVATETGGVGMNTMCHDCETAIKNYACNYTTNDQQYTHSSVVRVYTASTSFVMNVHRNTQIAWICGVKCHVELWSMDGV